MSSNDTRVTVHSEQLKLGKVPDPLKPSLRDQLKDSSVAVEAEKKRIKEIGYRLTYAQNRALFVVQQLLDETGYKGNSPAVTPTKGAAYKYSGKLPVLEIKTADFLDRYGVKKVKYNGRDVYATGGRRVAMNALKDLASREYLLVYDKSIKPGGKKTTRVEVIAPLLNLKWLNGNRRVRIMPNPVLVDHIKSYFILKPDDFFTKVSGTDSVEMRFLEYLSYHAFQKQKRAGGSKEIRVEMETIAWWLRLDSLLRSRKKKELRQRLTALYTFGVTQGYLNSFLTDQKGTKGRVVDVLELM